MNSIKTFALGMFIAAAPIAANAGAFLPYQKISVPGHPVSTVIGDVTGDGLDDVVVATTAGATTDVKNDYSLFVFVQKPNGKLSSAIKAIDPVTWNGKGGVNLAVSDLDNDGILDIVAAHQTGITIFKGNRNAIFDGKFVDTPALVSGLEDTTVAIFDINGDGHPDVLTEYLDFDGYRDEDLLAYFNDGAGGFPTQAPVETFGYGIHHAHDLKTGDLNDDGRTDFATFTGSAYSTYTALQDQSGGFLLPKFFPLATRVEIGDFNADGKDDIAYWTASASPYVGISAQGADGSFTSIQYLQIENGGVPSATLAADMDGDGHDDLVVVSPGNATLGYYHQAETGLEAVQQFALPVAQAASPTSLSTGDINNDNCRDVVMVHPDHGLIVLYGNACVRHASGKRRDFDGDGRSDILWRNLSTGADSAWKAGQSLTQLPLTGVTNMSWSIVGADDFDGDGHADVLWRDSVTGMNAAWRSGSYSTQLPVARVSDPAWQVAGTGDFNGDGRADILWRNSRTGMNAVWRSAGYGNQLPIMGVTNLDWAIVGTGDFDGDGHDDILWRNRRTGANAAWRSGNYAAPLPITGVTGLAWTVAATADFDGDGRVDILWRNSTTGANAVWRSGNYATQRPVMALGTAWIVADAGDYDGDGRADILWRNTSTGANQVWKSADASAVAAVATVSNLAWVIEK